MLSYFMILYFGCHFAVFCWITIENLRAGEGANFSWRGNKFARFMPISRYPP